ncbi:MAG TPA: endonuclease domain-containing protein, partial [Polyangiaceae bacterium]
IFPLFAAMHPHDGSPSLFSLVSFAREHRKNPTPSERIFWRAVCQKQLGVRVRRQHPLHPFIADFFVPSHRLVIEIDGGSHESEAARLADSRRDAELARTYGLRVLRLAAHLVEVDLTAALTLVRRALRA